MKVTREVKFEISTYIHFEKN